MHQLSTAIKFLIVLCSLVPLTVLGADFQTPAITPAKLRAHQQGPDKLLIVDVRAPAEYHVGHLPGAINLPVEDIGEHLAELQGQKGIVLYCIAGTRTKQAEQTLIDNEVPNLFHLQGGLMGWINAGLPIEKGAGHKLAHADGRH
jgi:rhodanese-related sulfurtransferase